MENCIQYCSGKFGIQGLTRLSQDSTYANRRDSESSKPGTYQSRNLHDCNCEAPYTKELSLQHPDTYYRDGNGWTSNNGCNIDNDSKLRNSRNLTNTKEIHQLMERPFLTVPYMGRGEGNTCIESSIRPGEHTMQHKSTNSLSGTHIDRYTPQ